MGALYTWYALAIVTVGYVVGELGHFLIGVTSKATSTDLDYGDISCQFNSTTLSVVDVPTQCDTAKSRETCKSLELNGTNYCEWSHNGQGLGYQLLAGSSFIAVFTSVGVIFGIAADRYNRVRLLAICTAVFSIAVIFQGAVTEYWQLFILRMLFAAGEAGCNPLSTGLLSDWFTEDKHGLVMSVFNWGIFGGQGITYPVGRYISALNFWGLGWRVCYYGAGIVGMLVAILTGLLKEPPRTVIGEEKTKEAKKESICSVISQPRIILLVIASSIRNSGGYCFAYNSDLYYRQYFPDYDLGWWLFAVTTVIGSIGVVVGGYVSDKFVAKMGVKSRVAVLALSQLFATPAAFGSVYFAPVGAMTSLAISYFFAEMWLGILFAVLVEIVPLSMRSTIVGLFLFVMNNVGGLLPILVEPVSKAIGYRESLWILYAGAYGLSSFMFLFTMFLMDHPQDDEPSKSWGQANRNFVEDENKTTTLELPRVPSKRSIGYEHSQL
ncbi:hypothetical protein QAD02_018698 [Eretmocerus hayati]|uniref:Uncharacterized protein n=1 Tax=Eretmocerus hayati TaxID=131215 RepID=A0ACC2PIQ5_9HYME|nr:hypothetical protein QAD02_018698 [Eretmocerus hayati]